MTNRKRQDGSSQILGIFPSEIRGGAEEYVLTVLAEVVRAGFRVAVAFPPRAATAGLVDEFRTAGVAYYPLEIAETGDRRAENRRHLKRLLLTLQLLLRVRPDAVQLTLGTPEFGLGSILACALAHVPTMVVFQLVPGVAGFGKRKLRLYRWARLSRQVWVAVSEDNRRLLCDSFGAGRGEVVRIYNGAAAAAFPPSEENATVASARAKVREELGLPLDSRVLLTVGRLHPQKGYVDLVRIARYIVDAFPGVCFVWVGDGEQRQELEQLAKGAGLLESIRLLGFRRDLTRLMSAADLFLFPSRYEGFPLALLQAMAIGLPIIASDCSSIPEIISDRIHGVLFPAGEVLALYHSVCWALNHPNEMQTMAARAKVRVKEFSPERMIAESLTVLRELGGGKTDRAARRPQT